MDTSISQLCKNRDVYVSKMANNMMTKYKIFWGYQDTQNFLLCVVVVLDPHFKLKYVRFCFRRLYDVEEVENFTMKIKDTLLRVFEYYINVEVVHSVGTSINEDVNIDLMVVDDDMLDDLASQFKKYLEEEGGVQRKNKVERYLGDDCEDPNDFKLDILG
jgi:hypothetical protein